MAGEHVLGRVAVRRADIGAAVGRPANDERDVNRTAGHVAQIGRIVQYLIERDGVKAPEHELDHRTDAEHGGADANADKSGLADRRVNDASWAETIQQALSDLVRSMKLADFFAHHDDVGIALQFFGQSLVESFAIGDEWHR